MNNTQVFETTSADAFAEMLKHAVQNGLTFKAEFDTDLEIYVLRFTGGF